MFSDFLARNDHPPEQDDSSAEQQAAASSSDPPAGLDEDGHGASQRVAREADTLHRGALPAYLASLLPFDGVGAEACRAYLDQRGWSAHRIKFEIAQQFGTRWGGGRRPLMPVDEAGVCQLLKKLCERWRRLNRELTRERTELQGVSLQEIALPVRKAFSSAVTNLERLQKAATARLKKLQGKQS